jgi:hypothetical protein
MSRFIDRLKQLSQGTPQPIGFRTSASTHSKLRIQMVAAVAVDGVDVGLVAEADAALVRTTRKAGAAEALKKLATPGGIPWGVSGVDGTAAGESADFVVFAAGASLKGVIGTRLGKVIEIDPALADSLLRAVNGLPVDAVLLAWPARSEALTWQDLMVVERVTAALNKPVLVPVAAAVSGEELKALWDAGVDGVVVEVAGGGAGTLNEVRQKIDALEFPTPKRGERTAHLVPRVAAEVGEREEEEEEQE